MSGSQGERGERDLLSEWGGNLGHQKALHLQSSALEHAQIESELKVGVSIEGVPSSRILNAGIVIIAAA